MLISHRTSKPLTQNVLPVLTYSGQLKGLVPIAVTTFDGEVAPSFVLTSGPVPVFVVQLETGGSLTALSRIEEYVAIVVPEDQEYMTPWVTYAGFVDVQNSGYYHNMITVTAGWVEQFSYGSVLGPLATGLDTSINYDGFVDDAESNGEDVDDQTPKPKGWLTSVNIETANTKPMFDYDWRYLFNLLYQDKTPLNISVVQQPTSAIKASVVTDAQGNVKTLRLIRLAPLQKQDYVVGVSIQADKQYDLQLTLRII